MSQKTIGPSVLTMTSKGAFTLIIALIGYLTGMANEKAHIIVRPADGFMPDELVISKGGDDPQKSPYRIRLENRIYECDIETDHIELYSIIDEGELQKQNHTSRTAQFLIEDGAVITLTVGADGISVRSSGKEMAAKEEMDSLASQQFAPRYMEIEKITDEKIAERMESELWDEFNDWSRDYYSTHPMIYFLLDLDRNISNPRFNNHSLNEDLLLYHSSYADKYPGHPSHGRIAENENYGYQIYGRKYHDYDVRSIDGEKVRAYDYLKPGYNLVICWATWCRPCRQECLDIAEFIGPYMDAGLNVFALTREFKNTDVLKKTIENDSYPWPTLVDLDNEFKVFDRHGATSSAVFLINPEGNIVFSGIGSDQVREALNTYMPDVSQQKPRQPKDGQRGKNM